MKPNGGNRPQAWFRRSRKRGPKGDAPSERHSLRIQTFPLSLKLNEPKAAAFRTILGQERRQADQKDEPQSIFLTKLLLFWSRPTASAPRRRRVPRRLCRISVARLQRESPRRSRRGPARNRRWRRGRRRPAPR